MAKEPGFFKEILSGNRRFISEMDPSAKYTLLALVLIQFSFYLYNVIVIPLEYDTWHSYRFFSGSSFWATLSYYPAPNNHVFYNLVSRLFVLAGIDIEVAVRLPSLLASVVTTYYFFRLCRKYFSMPLSLTLLVFLVTLYLFIIYSYEGRGYSFVNLFCVLLMYSSVQLAEDYKKGKYRLLFIMSMVLGMWSVPSFLYVTLPVCTLLTVYAWKQNQWKTFSRLITDGLISVALVLLAYLPILLNNDPDNLINPNQGGSRFSFSDEGVWDKMIQHLRILFIEFFSFDQILIISLLILVSFLYFIREKRSQSPYLAQLCVLMFFSPAIILVLHRLFPYGRNWLYLVLPAIICFGIIIDTGLSLLEKTIAFKPNYKFVNLYYLLLIFTCTTKLIVFSNVHRNTTDWDYHMDFFRRTKLNPVIMEIKQIAKTQTGWEFYPGEAIWNFCEKANPLENPKLVNLDMGSNAEICVISLEEMPKYRKKLLSYDFAFEHGDIFIYMKKGLGTSK